MQIYEQTVGHGTKAKQMSGRAAVFSAVLLVEVAAAYAITRGAIGATAVAGVLVFTTIVGFTITAPRKALFALAAVWGITHAAFSDYHLVSAGAIDFTLSRALGVLIVFSLGALLTVQTARGVIAPRLPLAFKALVAVVIYFVVIAVPLASSKSDALSDVLRIISGVLIGVVAFREVRTRRDFMSLARIVEIAGLIVALITLTQFLLLKAAPGIANAIFGSSFFQTSYDPTDQSAGAVRVAGPLGGAQETAGFLLVALGFALLRYNTLPSGRQRSRSALFAAVIGLAIAITLTRAAIGALLVLLVVWAVQRQRSSGTVALRLRVFGLIAVTAAVAVPVIGAATIASRLSDANPTTAGSNFAQGRAVIWSQEFHLIGTSSPLALFLGHGAHAAYVSIETPLGFVPDSPHNIFLWGIVEIGLAGTALYVAFLVSSIGLYARFARIERYRFKGQVAAVGIAMSIAYLVQDQFTLSVSSPGHRWYFMLFLGATLSVLVRSDAEKPATALDVDSPNDANSRSGARISLAPTGRA